MRSLFSKLRKTLANNELQTPFARGIFLKAALFLSETTPASQLHQGIFSPSLITAMLTYSSFFFAKYRVSVGKNRF